MVPLSFSNMPVNWVEYELKFEAYLIFILLKMREKKTKQETNDIFDFI